MPMPDQYVMPRDENNGSFILVATGEPLLFFDGILFILPVCKPFEEL